MGCIADRLVDEIYRYFGLLPNSSIELRAQWVLARLGWVELSQLDQPADGRVVAGDQLQASWRRQIGARVTDVADIQCAAHQQCHRACRAHVGSDRLGMIPDRAVGLLYGP